ncbi:MAG: type II toxin-antitoxin system VapC family toxin [Chloroflexota bacterium]
MKNVVDSSGWLEYFADGSNAGAFKSILDDEANLIIPSVCLYEVFKITLSRAGEDEALHVAGLMSFGQIIDFDRKVALVAAPISTQYKLAMADSVIYAIAQMHNATLWTQDAHFKDLPGVEYIEKRAK